MGIKLPPFKPLSIELDSKSSIVGPLDSAFTLEVVFPGGKRNANGYDVLGGKLIYIAGFNVSATEADVFYRAPVQLIVV
jgi:hypothetical protein